MLANVCIKGKKPVVAKSGISDGNRSPVSGKTVACVPVETLELLLENVVQAASIGLTLREKLRDKTNPKAFMEDVSFLETNAPTCLSLVERGQF